MAHGPNVMSLPYPDIGEWDDDTRAVRLGTLATIAFVAFFWLLPSVLPVLEVKTVYYELSGTWPVSNPLRPLRATPPARDPYKRSFGRERSVRPRTDYG